MAKTARGAALTELHRQTQIGVAGRTAARIAVVGRGLTLDTLEADLPEFTRRAAPIIQADHKVSATVAGRYAQAFRRAEGVRGAARIVLPDPPGLKHIENTIRTNLLAVSRQSLRTRRPAQALQRGMAETVGAAGRLVLEGGSDTLIGSADADKRVQGWARIASPGCCAYCAMLASRGPVYVSSSSARRAGHKPKFGRHNKCKCTVELVFDRSAWQMPKQSQRYAELWDSANGDRSEFRKLVDKQRK